MDLLVTAQQMREFDRAAIERFAIPGLLLMENAGRAFVEVLERTYGSLSGTQIVLLCGKGNNGGDGFVIARHLVNRNVQVIVGLLCTRSELKGDAATNFRILSRMAARGSSSLEIVELRTRRRLERLPKTPIVVDAIFGTGFSGNVSGMPKQAIEWINASQAHVASVDIPSGVDASTGIVGNVAVRADLTVTMGMEKIGQHTGEGKDCSGKVIPVEISIPRQVYSPSKGQVYRITQADVNALLPPRKRTAHKYSVGKVFVIAGSRSLTGAPFMCSQAAMRIGAGGVILGVPKSIHIPLVKKLTEVMITPLEETDEGTIAPSSSDQIQERIKWADVVALGPGLGTNSATAGLVFQLVERNEKPLIIDADGLNVISSNLPVLKKRKSPVILTPHVGELSRLTGWSTSDIERDRIGRAREAARKLRSVVVLKGAPTVTATIDGEVFLNPTGNPGMASAGMGDVLTGVIAGLFAQGMKAHEAAYAGAYLHGLAADLAVERVGERSLMASDVLDYLPGAIGAVKV